MAKYAARLSFTVEASSKAITIKPSAIYYLIIKIMIFFHEFAIAISTSVLLTGGLGKIFDDQPDNFHLLSFPIHIRCNL